MAPKKKVTSSGDRSKRSAKKPVTRGQNPQRANRQAASKATVSSSEMRDPARVRAGINKSNKPGAGKVTGTMGRPKPATPAKVTTGSGGKTRPALPPGNKGGALTVVRSENPRRTSVRSRLQTAARGTTGPNRVGQPPGSANRIYGATVVNRSVNRAIRATRLGAAGKMLGRAAIPLAMAQEITSMVDREKRMQAIKQKGITRRAKAASVAKGNTSKFAGARATAISKAKTIKGSPVVGPKKVTPQSSIPKPRKVTAPTAKPSPKPTRSTATTKPVSKPQSASTSGIGPVSSGESYSRMKTSISEQLRELRAMRKASEERQKKK